MNDAITIITPKSLSEAKELAQTLAAARSIPEVLQKSPADVLAIVLAGAELGLAPMQSIRGIRLIKGQPALSADAMGALVKARRDVCQYLLLVESTPQRATYRTQRVGDPQPTELTYTLEDAQRAGLTSGDNWRKYPAAMLRARCLSAICRAVYPDLLLGVYDPEELASVEPPRPAQPAEVVDAVVQAATAAAVSTPAPQPSPPQVAQPLPPQPESVPAQRASPPAAGVVIENGARLPKTDNPHYAELLRLAKEAGEPWSVTSRWLKARGRKRPADVTKEDVEAWIEAGKADEALKEGAR
jgi:hypothetical protein